MKAFGDSITERGIEKRDSGRFIFYLGIGLVDARDEPADPKSNGSRDSSDSFSVSSRESKSIEERDQNTVATIATVANQPRYRHTDRRNPTLADDDELIVVRLPGLKSLS